MRKLISTFAIVLLIGMVSFTAIAQRRSKVREKTSTAVEYKPPTEDERRRQVEERMLKGEYQHDGAGELMYIGTRESVPALLRVLKDHPPYVEFIEPLPPPLPGHPPNPAPKAPRRWYKCTYHHAAVALRKITGQNLFWYEDWVKWWEVENRDKIESKP